ncbi:MAG: RNA polymerase sigma factor RpoD, partial [Rhodospirillales bacterium]|nr:RNA polymerase sigma factor RpoD [Rhodospirillales bacterium]
MATKATTANESQQESNDAPVIEATGAAIKKLLARGKERGFVTYDELNAALPPDDVSSEQIEDTMTTLSELGVNVVESEDAEEASPEAAAGAAEAAPVASSTGDEDLGRTDDPVRMYLREMGSVELLSSEGVIDIAKRIEAGREKMIGSICESPLTLRAIMNWREALAESHILLRDVIDLDATYGGGPNATAMTDGAANTAPGDSLNGANANGASANGADVTATENDPTSDDEDEAAEEEAPRSGS